MKRSFFAAIGLVVVACSPAAPAPVSTPPHPHVVAKAPPLPPQETEPVNRADGRLPETVRPLRYDLKFDVDPAAGGFRGVTTILVHASSPTSYVVLNGRQMDVSHVSAEFTNGEITGTWSARRAHGSVVDDELILHFPKPIPAGDARIEIAYDAPFANDLAGLYKVVDGGKPYVFTQFEATDARRAFPCFDDPQFKVPFDVSIRVRNGFLAVANGPETKRDTAGDATTFTFATTPPLPTYLVAFAVGDFDVREGRKTPFPIRLITTKGKSAEGALALDTAAALVDRLQTYFGIQYPYPKLDIVAVPDFAAGAMENAGLVTFREELLLLPPDNGSARARHVQAAVIAHEFAHQWFGDLVTMPWWDDIWLNEAFASWMEAKTLDGYQPSYNATLGMVRDGLAAMRTDALSSARAVRQAVATAGEADEAFDDLTYDKGAAVIAMLEDYVGAETFRSGVRAYLRRHAWGSARAKDLFAAIDEAHGGGDDIARIASSFLDQTGFPSIHAETKCDGKSWSAHLTQNFWRPIGAATGDAAPTKTWVVPLSLLSDVDKDGSPHHTLLARADGTTDSYPAKTCPKFVTPNAHQAGYFRFAVADKELLPMMRAKLDTAARMGLVANAWANIQDKSLAPATFLEGLRALDGEKNRFIVGEEADVLAQMNDSVIDDSDRAQFRAFVEARLGPLANKLGWERKNRKKAPTPAEEEEALLRHDLLFAVANLAEGATLTQAEKIATEWLKDPASVDPDTGPVALELASRRAKSDRFDALRAAAKNATNPQYRVAAIRAMGGFSDPQLLERALDWTMSDEVKEQDVRYVLRAALANRALRPVVLAWTKAHWDAAIKKEPGLGRVAYLSVVGNLCDSDSIADARTFFAAHVAEIKGGARPFAEDVERATNCMKLHEVQAAPFAKALGGNRKSPTK